MAEKAVVDAVEARLADRWSTSAAIAARAAEGLPALPFIGVNTVGDTPENGSPYGMVQYPVSESEQITLGRVYRESGGIRFIINVERGAGTEVGLRLASQLATLFRDRRFGRVRTFAPSSPVVDDRNEEGMYFSFTFAVPYEYIYRDDTGGFYD